MINKTERYEIETYFEQTYKETLVEVDNILRKVLRVYRLVHYPTVVNRMP